MRKITAILLLIIYLLSTNGVNELLKTGRLVQHFCETNSADRQVNIFQFLVMHYIGDDLNDKDNDQDMQLPFKSNELRISSNTVLPLPYRHIKILETPSKQVSHKILFLRNDILIENNFNVPIWHPPKYS